MKIEKINENQIRCTLTKSDLQKRQLKISELAYGSEKAKSLFRDMMEQAAYQFGFEADDIPLMIEAVPLNAECIVLTITKVEDPEELDTRFAKFAPSVMENDAYGEDDSEEGVDTDYPFFAPASSKKPIKKSNQGTLSAVPADTPSQGEQGTDKEGTTPGGEKAQTGVTEVLFTFRSLDNLMQAAEVMGTLSVSDSALFKDPKSGYYLLHVCRGQMDIADFQKVYFLLSEYGKPTPFPTGILGGWSEHYDTLIGDHALEKLLQMK